MAQQFTIVTLEKLQTYHSSITSYINDADAKSLKSVAISGNTIKFYKEASPTAETAAAFSIDLPETDISNLLEKFASATAGDVVTVAADGKNIVDSGVKVADLATNAKVKEVSDLVGTIPEGYTATTIADYAKELADNVAANGYDDTELAGRVAAVEGKVNTLQDADTVEGSVAKQIKDAKTELTTEIEKKATKGTTLSEYGIADAYTKGEVDSAIATKVANAEHLKREIVSDLPAVGSADAHTIYMVSITDGSGNQKYEEFMLINDAFEKIGDSAVDLTNYATKTEVGDAKTEAINTAASDATGKANQALADAKTYADGLAGNYATAAQGTKADSALQKADIVEGATDGTIKVKGDDVKVHGLGTAAYAAVGAFDAAGVAETKVNALATGAVATNTSDISDLKSRVGTLESTTFVEATDAQIQALFTTN